MGSHEEDISFSDNATVKDLIESLIEKYGKDFEYAVLNVDSRLRSDVLILLNGINIDQINGLDSKLIGKEIEIVFTPMIEGG